MIEADTAVMDHVDTIARSCIFATKQDCYVSVRYIDRAERMHVPRGSLRGHDRAPDEDGIIGERQEIRLSVGGFVMLRRRLPVSRGTY